MIRVWLTLVSLSLTKFLLVVYVDNTLLFSPKAEFIDEMIKKMKNSGIELEVKEQDVAGFLGMSIKPVKGGICLTQEGLIVRITDALGVSHLPKQDTPASAVPLVKDADGDPPYGDCNYTSVIGMMQCLQAHLRPEISHTVSQCTRFMHCP